MQLSFDAADRLVELIQARRGAVGSEEAARVLFALERAPATLAHSLLSDVAITGLSPNESLVGIDFRPNGEQLYGVSDASRIYTINPVTGVATPVAPNFTPTVAGTSFGMDFNPTVDRIRLVSEFDQNLRLNPVTGTVASTDGTLHYATGDPNQGANPNVVAAAYTNNFPGATTTLLYDIDDPPQHTGLLLYSLDYEGSGYVQTDLRAWLRSR